MSTAPALYDPPGPRGRRRILIWSVVSALVIVGAVVAGLLQFAAKGQLDAAKWQPFLFWPIWSYLLTGLLGTLQAAALVAVIGSIAGVLLAVGRVSRVRPLRWICTTYIEIARTLPVLLLIYVMLFGLPQLGLDFPVLWKLVIPLSIANAAAFAEIVRAGILGLPSGQAEAGLSLGMTGGQTMRLVVLPQSLRFVTPSLVTQLVSLVKDTSLGYVVAYTELLYRGQVLASFNRLLIQSFIAVTLIYLLCNGLLSALASRLRTRQRRRAPAAAAAEDAAAATAAAGRG